ncbi:glutathione peroxidase [Lactococcus ileimucosae]|uniref:glutathione peroxidase n=1 Tax=Lactococcus ileimucosae TaxID=2941329 RepID=UPI00204362DE|nr:glutathione peroxidase [Lactococcus ileimucosae]
MSIYDFIVKGSQGEDVSLSAYEGKVLLVVNTATKCGFTPQYDGLQKLYENYKDEGLEILDFPCNQFKEQAPGTAEEINQFCSLNYGTTFPRFQKIDVNGENESPLYTWLKAEKGSPLGKKIKWNFTKFLINRQGEVVARYAPATTPEKIAKDIVQELKTV